MSYGFGFHGWGRSGGRGGRRARNMYYATGLPGWLRFGYSPGWIERSPSGLPPAAEYLMQTGNIPDFYQYLQNQTKQPTTISSVPIGISPDEERKFLANQVEILEKNLKQLHKRLEELTNK